MTKSDARKVGELHEQEFGVPGVMGCLDCMHVHWKNCPAAWQGQHKGAKEQPSMVLEAISDYNLWFWHSFFGPPGTLNDVNIWDRSTMLRSFLDGTFEECDCEHTVAGKVFNMVTFLVDGTYPELARFVKTVSVPLNKVQKKCAAWQEGSRKSIERAFGVLQRKFHILCRPVELCYEDDIAAIVDACLILHNMMVETRIQRDELEADCVYDQLPADEADEDDRERLMQRQSTQGTVSTSDDTTTTSTNTTGRDRDPNRTRTVADQRYV